MDVLLHLHLGIGIPKIMTKLFQTKTAQFLPHSAEVDEIRRLRRNNVEAMQCFTLSQFINVHWSFVIVNNSIQYQCARN